MSQKKALIALLLVFTLLSAMCLGSNSQNETKNPTASETPTNTQTHYTESSSQASPSTTNTPCNSCQVSPSKNDSTASSSTDTGSQKSSSTSTSTSQTSTPVENNESSSQTPSGENTTETSTETPSNPPEESGKVTLPHDFPPYKLPLNRSLIKFYIYGSSECCKCRRLVEYLTEEYGSDSIVFYEINEGNNRTIVLEGLLNEYSTLTSLPITGISYNGTLVAVISGFNEPYDVEGPIKTALKYRVVFIRDSEGNTMYTGSKTKRAVLEAVFLYNMLPEDAG